MDFAECLPRARRWHGSSGAGELQRALIESVRLEAARNVISENA